METTQNAATENAATPPSVASLPARRSNGMSPANTAWDRELDALLEAVLDLTPADRERFLERNASSPEIARHVESMLRDEAELGSFMGGSPETSSSPTEAGGADDSWSPADLRPGDRLRSFRILGLLGQGGMGQVYRAEQEEPIRRLVALKVISHALGLEGESRFRAERQALGRLGHPNIARLYEAGANADGRPFVAMELVEGPPITGYCDERQLSCQARLRLFLAVCRGAQHAHQKQILHRDLKPSNILVTEIDGPPEVKIIDFGIAKALGQPLTDQTLATGQALIGTPHYMSPEALEGEGELDTRSDVYSLGLVLYELLAGCHPFQISLGELPQIVREILSTPPPPPSQLFSELPPEERDEVAQARGIEPGRLSRLLASDMDWIVMKAMARARDGRYGSVAEMADDIERALAGKPVLARPPSLGYRLRKWVIRNRLATGLGSLTAAGLIAATTVTSLAMVRAQHAERQSRQDAQVSRQALDFVIDLFEAASPEVMKGEPVDVRQLLEAGAERIRESPIDSMPRAEILSTLARVQVHLGQYPEAVELAMESLDIRQQAITTGGLSGDDPAVFSSLDLLANALRRAGRGGEAEPLLERLVELARANGDQTALADALNTFGSLRWSQDRFDEAETLYREALELRISALGDAAPEVASSHNNLGVLLLSSARSLEAEPHLRRAAELLEAQLGEQHPNTLNTLNNLGLVLQGTGRLEESFEVQQRVLELRTAVLGPDHPAVATSHSNLATALRDLGRYAEAEQSVRRAVEIRRQTLGPDHNETLKALTNLGNVLRRQQRLVESEEVLNEALERRQRTRGPEDLGVAHTRRSLALVWRETGRFEAARSALQEVLTLQRRKLGDGHHNVALTLYHLGVLERQAGAYAEAETLLRQAIAKRRALGALHEKRLADSLIELAELAALQGREAERAALLVEALSILRRVLPAEHPELQELARSLR
ncbi:MAG: serine/threonine-protein kinase [Acidobacteriota bacterium]